MYFEKRWHMMFEKAVEYSKEHGNLEVPSRYKTEDGYPLGAWIQAQRVAYKNRSLPISKRLGKGKILTDEQVEKLESIGMVWDVADAYWNKMYEKLLEYLQENGDVEVPAKYITSDGYKLGIWLAKQRERCDLDSEHGQLLCRLGVRFERRKRINFKWMDFYKLAKKYYDKYHNLEIKSSFKTNDGITYDENGEVNLGIWVIEQRGNCNPMSERGQLLLKIGMRFDKNINIVPWKVMYDKAKSYFIEHGNLYVLGKYVTEDGYKLGAWLIMQRRLYKRGELSFDKIILLEYIGMIWSSSDNRFKIAYLCDKYDIEIEKNINVLRYISSTVFAVKINFINELKNNGYDIDIVDANGVLNEIFSMSNVNMQAKYGSSLEELINNYNEYDRENCNEREKVMCKICF